MRVGSLLSGAGPESPRRTSQRRVRRRMSRRDVANTAPRTAAPELPPPSEATPVTEVRYPDITVEPSSRGDRGARLYPSTMTVFDRRSTGPWRHGHYGYAAASLTSTRPTPGPRSAACSATRPPSSLHATLSSGRRRCRTASSGPPSRQRREPVTSRFAAQTSSHPTMYPGSPMGHAHEDVAIAGAWSFLNGRDCGIYTVGTQPEWRRHGCPRPDGACDR